MALQRTDQKYILSFCNTDSPWCMARTTVVLVIYTRGGGSWYFRPRSRGAGLANFTPIAGMGHLISKPKFKIPTPSPLLISEKSLTGKNNGFPFLDILGYLKNTHKNPKFGNVRQVPTREFPTKFPDWDLSHSSKFGIFVGILYIPYNIQKWESVIFSCA